jgi:hypothetical protein
VQWDSVVGIYQSKMCDLVKTEAVFSILTEFDMLIKPVRLMNVRVNETCSRIYVSEYLCDAFCIHSGLRQGDFLVGVAFHLRFIMCY